MSQVIIPLIASMSPIEHGGHVYPICTYQNSLFYHGAEVSYSVFLNKDWYSVFSETSWRQFHNRSFSASTGIGFRWQKLEGVTIGTNAFYDMTTMPSFFVNQLGIGLEFLSRIVDVYVNAYVPWPENIVKKGHEYTAHNHIDVDVVYKTRLVSLGISPYMVRTTPGIGLHTDFTHAPFCLSIGWKHDSLTKHSGHIGFKWNFPTRKNRSTKRYPYVQYQKTKIEKIEIVQTPLPNKKQEDAVVQTEVVPLPVQELAEPQVSQEIEVAEQQQTEEVAEIIDTRPVIEEIAPVEVQQPPQPVDEQEGPPEPVLGNVPSEPKEETSWWDYFFGWGNAGVSDSYSEYDYYSVEDYGNPSVPLQQEDDAVSSSGRSSDSESNHSEANEPIVFDYYDVDDYSDLPDLQSIDVLGLFDQPPTIESPQLSDMPSDNSSPPDAISDGSGGGGSPANSDDATSQTSSWDAISHTEAHSSGEFPIPEMSDLTGENPNIDESDYKD